MDPVGLGYHIAAKKNTNRDGVLFQITGNVRFVEKHLD